MKNNNDDNNQDDKDNNDDATSCILANVEAISSKSVLEALVIAPTCEDQYIVLLTFWLKIGCVFDLAIQVAGSGEALKDREGEMVEKRVLVDGVFHFGNLGAQNNWIYIWTIPRWP